MTQSINIEEKTPSLALVEPVLSVRDIHETVMYWHETLGFPGKWTWGDPPNHGGASWAGVSVQFSLNPKLAEASKGNSIWISVRNLPTLYTMHQEKAKIISPLENKPWGSAEYTVEEINGYYIHFSGPQAAKEIESKALLDSIKLIQRKPTISEVRDLMISVGWANASVEDSQAQIAAMQLQIANAVVVVVAENEKSETIGIAFLLGDNKHFYYVKDVIVHSKWQRNRVGTHLMQYLMQWLRTNAPKPSTVGLFTGDHLASFYKQFGFMQACGMYQQIL
jgi:GNAT superfamily N-acetyltransferase